jgi:P27 family predicted phage terminase small subunit
MMGKRGPQKTPTKTLKERGSWLAKLPERQNEISIPGLVDPPEPPDWLDSGGRDQFIRLAPVMHALGLLSFADIDAMGLYAERLAQYIELRDSAAKQNSIIINNGRVYKNPTYSLRDEAQRDCIRLLRELGMSPTARVGLTTEKKTATPATLMMETEGGYAT